MTNNYTFGSTKAALNLSKMIDENPEIKKTNILRIFYRFVNTLRAIREIKNKEVKEYLAQLVLKEIKITLSKPSKSPSINSHILNVLQSEYRKTLHD